MASTKDSLSISICLVRAASTPAQLLPRPSMTTQPLEPLTGTTSPSYTSTSPLFLRSSWRLNSATASQATARSRSPLPQTAPLTPTMSGLIRASSSRSEIFRCPDSAVLMPSDLPSSTMSFRTLSDMKLKRLRPSLVRVSMRNPSHSPSLASWTMHMGSRPFSKSSLSAKTDPTSLVLKPSRAMRASRSTSTALS